MCVLWRRSAAPPACAQRTKAGACSAAARSCSSDSVMAGTAVVCAIVLLCAVKVRGFDKNAVDGAHGEMQLS